MQEAFPQDFSPLPEDLAALFRRRLQEVILRAGTSQSAFAEDVGLDRSTLSLLLSGKSQRLPRASTLIAIARAGGVSLDWLLGLSEDQVHAAEYLTQVLEVAQGEGHPYDTRLHSWLQDVVGQKVRHVPASLPDLLKTEAVIAYEFARFEEETQKAQEERFLLPLLYTRRRELEMDACCSVQSLQLLAAGQGIWSELPRALRLQQLRHMQALVDELYPAFRWFLYDGRRFFSSPLTIYGAKRATLYIGNMYFVLNGRDEIQILSRHFDDLVRGAHVQPTDVKDLLDRQIQKLS